MSERNNVLILLALFAIMGLAATAMQIFQGTDTTTITVSLNNTGNLDTPVQSITYISQSRADIKSMLDTHIVSGYSDPRYIFNGDFYASRSSTVIDPSSEDLTDYPMAITLTHADFPDLSSDFSDIRFKSGTETDYWIKSFISDTSAESTIKIPSISSVDGAVVQAYFGNSGVSSTSSGNNTFIQYSGSTTSDYHHTNAVQVPFIFENRIKRTTSTAQFAFGASNIADILTTPDSAIAGLQLDTANTFYSRACNDGTCGYTSNAFTHTLNTYYDTKIVAESLSSVKYYDGDTLKATRATTIPDELMGLSLDTFQGTYEQEYAYIRKYTATEPTWSSSIWIIESTTAQITPSTITLNSITNTTGIYGSYPIIPANTAQDFSLNGTQNFNYTIDFTPTDLTVMTSSSALYADRAHTFNAVVTDHNTGTVMPTQPDKVKYRLVGSGNTSVSAKEFVGTSLTLPALQKGTYTLFTSVGWNNIPTWSNEISQSVTFTDAATPIQAVALSVVEALTDTTTDTTSNETTKEVLVGAPGRIADGWKSIFDTIITLIKNIIHNVSVVFS